MGQDYHRAYKAGAQVAPTTKVNSPRSEPPTFPYLLTLFPLIVSTPQSSNLPHSRHCARLGSLSSLPRCKDHCTFPNTCRCTNIDSCRAGDVMKDLQGEEWPFLEKEIKADAPLGAIIKHKFTC